MSNIRFAMINYLSYILLCFIENFVELGGKNTLERLFTEKFATMCHSPITNECLTITTCDTGRGNKTTSHPVWCQLLPCYSNKQGHNILCGLYIIYGHSLVVAAGWRELHTPSSSLLERVMKS